MAIWMSSCSCISRCFSLDWATGTWGSRARALWRYSVGRSEAVAPVGALLGSEAPPVACDALRYRVRWGGGGGIGGEVGEI